MTKRAIGLLTIPVLAIAAVVGAEVVAAQSRTYLTDVPFTVDATVGDAGGGTPIELRVLGDSTVAGVGTDRAADALPTLIARRVADRTGRPVHVVGLGVSGARTADVTRSQLPQVRDADVVVIVVGSNDVIHLTGPGTVRDQTAAMLDAAAGTGVPVVLGGVPRFTSVGAFAQPLRAIADGYARTLRDVQQDVATGDDAVTFVDIATLASPRFRGVPEAMSRDGFHPAEVGYGFWADAIAPAVVAGLRG